MSAMKENIYKDSINAKGTNIAVFSDGKENDYISLTDLAKYKNPEFPSDVIKNWMRLRSTIEFLGVWEQLNNTDFKLVEFDGFKNEAGSNSFVLSPQKWVKTTNAIGIVSKSGRYGGGTVAHKDIAFEFASWLSPEFKLYVIRDYQRLKNNENSKLSLEWNVNRYLSKINYTIHTDAIKEYIISDELTQIQKKLTYADEADMLNVVLFNKTAKEWRKENPKLKGNIRDYASTVELLVMSNLENTNALLISQGLSQPERFVMLRKIAKEQMMIFVKNNSDTKLKIIDKENKKGY